MTSPMMKYSGLHAKKATSFRGHPPFAESPHTPLFFILSDDGKSTPQMCLDHLNDYGAGWKDKLGPHYTHQNDAALNVIENGGSVCIQRIVLPDATRANLRIGIEVIQTMLPLYERDTFGNYLLDENNELVILDTIQGYRLINHVNVAYSVGDAIVESFYRAGDTLSVDGLQVLGFLSGGESFTYPDSKYYPLFELEYENFGSGGNELQVEILKDGLGQPLIRIHHTGQWIADVPFTLDGDSDRIDLIDLPFIRQVKLYPVSIRELKSLLVYGQSGITEYLDLFESDVVSIEHKSRIFEQLDLFNCSFPNHVPYPNIVNDSEWFDGSPLTEGNRYSLLDGSNGYPVNIHGEVDREWLLQVFDEACKSLYQEISNGGHLLCDAIRFPYRSIYDTGYSMATKFELAKVINSRPEVSIFLTPYSVMDWIPKIGRDVSCAGANIDAAISFTNSGERYTVEIDGQQVARGLNMVELYSLLQSQPKLQVELLQRKVKSVRFFTSGLYPKEEDFELSSSLTVHGGKLAEVPQYFPTVDLTVSLDTVPSKMTSVLVERTIVTELTGSVSIGTVNKLTEVLILSSVEESVSSRVDGLSQGSLTEVLVLNTIVTEITSSISIVGGSLVT